MLTSSRDNWERLVAAVLRREELWQLFHADSIRSPSISSASSDSTRYHSRRISSVADDISSSPQPPVPPANASPSPVTNNTSGATMRGGVAPRATAIFTAPRNMFAWYRRRKHSDDEYPLPEVYDERFRRFSLRELEIATDKFSNRNIVGRDGFGKVYKGRLSDGSLVAVKRLNQDVRQKVWFRLVVDVMSSMVLHPNIVSLLGFCITRAESLLVYPFMINGNVASQLRGRFESQPPLEWRTRVRIARGSAGGLAYLHEHCDPKIIHRDIKAANILLDEDYEAVVGGFELAKFMGHGDDDIETAVYGTIGHIAPEYLSTGRCSEKTDVFAYGMFLLELFTGERAFDLARLANDDDVMLLDWVKGHAREKKWEILVDADLQGNYVEVEMEQLLHLALLCTKSSPWGRPKMSEIFSMLENIGGDENGLVGRLEDWLLLQEENSYPRPALLRDEDEWNEAMLREEFNSWWAERQEEDELRERVVDN